jgi:hypothetical protein
MSYLRKHRPHRARPVNDGKKCLPQLPKGKGYTPTAQHDRPARICVATLVHYDGRLYRHEYPIDVYQQIPITIRRHHELHPAS